MVLIRSDMNIMPRRNELVLMVYTKKHTKPLENNNQNINQKRTTNNYGRKEQEYVLNNTNGRFSLSLGHKRRRNHAPCCRPLP